MRSAVVVDAARTPVGRAHPEKGIFRAPYTESLKGAFANEVASSQ